MLDVCSMVFYDIVINRLRTKLIVIIKRGLNLTSWLIDEYSR